PPSSLYSLWNNIHRCSTLLTILSDSVVAEMPSPPFSSSLEAPSSWSSSATTNLCMRDDFADAQLLQEADLLVRELGFLMEEVKAYSLLAIQLREPQFATEGERHAFQG